MTTHKVEVVTAGMKFSVEAPEDRLLLDALNATGLPLRNPCRNGVCGLCRCRLLEGEIDYLRRKPHGLWEKHLDAGFILPCIAFARSDLVVDEISLLLNQQI